MLGLFKDLGVPKRAFLPSQVSRAHYFNIFPRGAFWLTLYQRSLPDGGTPTQVACNGVRRPF
jgi:hypothetical protein